MFKPHIFIIIFLLAYSCAPRNDSSEVQIVGGTTVNNPDDLTFKSTLRYIVGNGSCTATLIGPNHVVTAGHCISGMNKGYLGFGTNGNRITSVQISSIKTHPRFNPRTLASDIAIISFDGSLPAELTPVIVADSSKVTMGKNIIIAGYGVTSENGSNGGILRKTNSRIGTIYTNQREFHQVTGERTGSCYGDSGGPVYIQEGEKLEIIGATSRGDFCNRGDGIYSFVSMYQGWMKCEFEKMGKPLDYLANDSSSNDCSSNNNANNNFNQQQNSNNSQNANPPTSILDILNSIFNSN